MQQAYSFFHTLLLGIVLGAFFHFYWLLLRIARMGRKLLTLTDALFCLVLLVWIGAGLFLINAGDLRLYVWIGLGFGGWVYRQCFSRFFAPGLNRLAAFAVRLAGFVKRSLLFPGRMLHKWLQKPADSTETGEDADETEEK